MTASVGTESEAATDDVVPVALSEAIEVIATNAVAYNTIEDTGIEIIASTDSAHGNDRLYRIALGKGGAMQFDTLGSTTIDETRAVELNLFLEHFRPLVDMVEDREILIGATYDISILQILDDGTHELDSLTGMVAAKIDIIVNNGTYASSSRAVTL